MSPERDLPGCVDLVVEAPYVHATGPMVSRFLTALRDGRVIYGARCERCGKVVVPPTGHCEICGGALGELIPVGPGGVVVGATTVASESAALGGPFAYVRVRLDGADTELVHLARDPASAVRGARVRPVWVAARVGSIRDIACFEVEGGPCEPDERAPGGEPVTTFRTQLDLRYRVAIGEVETRFREGLRRGELLGNRCGSCASVYVPPRPFCPRCFVPCGDWAALPHTGAVSTFVIVNVPFSGQEIEIPYVLANVRIDGADATFFHLVGVIGPRGMLIAPPGGARVGMRVRAAWKAEPDRRGLLNDDIDHFEPFDE